MCFAPTRPLTRNRRLDYPASEFPPRLYREGVIFYRFTSATLDSLFFLFAACSMSPSPCHRSKTSFCERNRCSARPEATRSELSRSLAEHPRPERQHRPPCRLREPGHPGGARTPGLARRRRRLHQPPRRNRAARGVQEGKRGTRAVHPGSRELGEGGSLLRCRPRGLLRGCDRR